MKAPSDTQLETVHLMMPGDANPSGNVFGGKILSYADEIAGAAARRHCKSNVVTASFERTHFFHPVYIGNLLILKAMVNFVSRTSLEVGVRIEAEDMKTGERTHTGSCFVTLVALDSNGKPERVEKLAAKTPEEKRRWNAAAQRRKELLLDLKRHGTRRN